MDLLNVLSGIVLYLITILITILRYDQYIFLERMLLR